MLVHTLMDLLEKCGSEETIFLRVNGMTVEFKEIVHLPNWDRVIFSDELDAPHYGDRRG